MSVEDKRYRACPSCLWCTKTKYGSICKNPDSKYRGSWVSKNHVCGKHRWKEDA